MNVELPIKEISLVRWDDRRKYPEYLKYRSMTLEEAKALPYGDHIWFIGLDGKARQLKINGQPKTWKRSPGKVRIPVKYGMYEYLYFTEQDLYRMLVPIEQEDKMGKMELFNSHDWDGICPS